jgi:hypothetical protein
VTPEGYPPGEGARLKQMGMAPELVDTSPISGEGYFGAPEVRVLAEAIKLFMADR